MRGPFLTLGSVSLSLAWLVFVGGGGRLNDWFTALLFLGATFLFYWTFRSGQTPPRLPKLQAFAMWSLPLYALLQLVPLPPVILEILSPGRWLITQSLAGVLPASPAAPLSVSPSSSLLGFFGLLGCLATYNLLRDLSWRFNENHAWIPVLPFVIIATIEAGVGIGQWLSGTGAELAMGTLSNHNYFAGVLEIALPFTLVFGFISLRRYQTQESSRALLALQAGLAWTCSGLLVLALFHSNSPASPVVVAGSIFVLLALAMIPRLKTRKLRWSGAAVILSVALLATIILAPPPDAVQSAAGMARRDQPESRAALWNNSAALWGEFRWLGAGLGSFESTFPKYLGSAALNLSPEPASDVLLLLISFGIVGSALALVVIVGLLRPAIVGSLYLANEPRRLLAVSVTASVCAVLIRSCVESTFSVPALAMLFAWLAGISQSSGVE